MGLEGGRAGLAATSLTGMGTSGIFVLPPGEGAAPLRLAVHLYGLLPFCPCQEECSVPGTCCPVWSFYICGLWEALVPSRSELLGSLPAPQGCKWAGGAPH